MKKKEVIQSSAFEYEKWITVETMATHKEQVFRFYIADIVSRIELNLLVLLSSVSALCHTGLYGVLQYVQSCIVHGTRQVYFYWN